MNYQKIILVGNTTGNAQLRTSKDGNTTYATFSVGVSEAKDRNIFFTIAVFGKRAENVAKYVTKGRQVLVEGRIVVSNKGRFNVIADHMRLGPQTGQPEYTKKAQG